MDKNNPLPIAKGSQDLIDNDFIIKLPLCVPGTFVEMRLPLTLTPDKSKRNKSSTSSQEVLTSQKCCLSSSLLVLLCPRKLLLFH